MGEHALHRVVHEFHGLCEYAFDGWAAYRALFDDNPHEKRLDEEPLRSFFVRWQEIAITHSLLQISKLHDPARQANRDNLSVAYILGRREWDSKTRAELRTSAAKLDELAEMLVEARKWTLAHNDLESVMANLKLGGFPADLDKVYFTDLERFVLAVQERAGMSARPFKRTAEPDVAAFLKQLGFA